MPHRLKPELCHHTADPLDDRLWWFDDLIGKRRVIAAPIDARRLAARVDRHREYPIADYDDTAFFPLFHPHLLLVGGDLDTAKINQVACGQPTGVTQFVTVLFVDQRRTQRFGDDPPIARRGREAPNSVRSVGDLGVRHREPAGCSNTKL